MLLFTSSPAKLSLLTFELCSALQAMGMNSHLEHCAHLKEVKSIAQNKRVNTIPMPTLFAISISEKLMLP